MVVFIYQVNTDSPLSILFRLEFNTKMKLSLLLPFLADGRVYRPKTCVKKGDALAEMRRAAAEMGWQMVQSNIDENTVVSPLSIAGALHMLAAGSRFVLI